MSSAGDRPKRSDVRRPRVYLDIDGSICPLPPAGRARPKNWTPPTDDWSAWVDPRAFNETPFPVELLDDLAALDWADVVWATSWSLDTIERAVDKVGYSMLRFRHLGPSGIYNKFEALRADIEHSPVPFVWIEDHHMPGESKWHPPVLFRRVRPDKYVGITRQEWRDALAWLRNPSDWRSTRR